MAKIRQISPGMLKKYSKLKSKKQRIIEQLFLVEGVNAITELIDSPFSVKALLLTENFAEKRDDFVEKLLTRYGDNLYFIPNKGLSMLSGTVTPQGIFAVTEKYVWTKDHDLFKDKRLIFLENISEPSNLAAVIRNAAWFGFDGILVSANSVDIYGPKVIRGSSGAFFHLPVYDNMDFEIIREMLGSHLWVGADLNANIMLNETKKSEKIVLCFGNETAGLSNQVLKSVDELILIPSPEQRIESLNLAISSGIFMYEFSTR